MTAMINSRAFLFITLVSLLMVGFLQPNKVSCPLGFSYPEDAKLYMDIVLENIPLSYVNYYTVYLKTDSSSDTASQSDVAGESLGYKQIYGEILSFEKQKTIKFEKSLIGTRSATIYIEVRNKISASPCVTKIIANGLRDNAAQGVDRSPCTISDQRCQITVDLKNVCDNFRIEKNAVTNSAPHQNQSNATLEPPIPTEAIIEDLGQQNRNKSNISDNNGSTTNLVIYIVASVMGAIILLSVLIIGIKRICHRKAENTLELDTYSNPTRILYAELDIQRGDDHQLNRLEESPYAEIIGVLKPQLKT